MKPQSPQDLCGAVMVGIKTVDTLKVWEAGGGFYPLSWALALVEKPFCIMRVVSVLINGCKEIQSPEPRPAEKEGYLLPPG